MKRLQTGFLGLMFLVLASVVAEAAEVDQSRIIVRLRPSPSGPQEITKGASGRPDFDRVIGAWNVESVDQVLSPAATPVRGRDAAHALRLHDYVIVQAPSPANSQGLLQALRLSRDVEKAEFDVIVRAVGIVTPNDPYFATSQYALRNTGVEPPNDPGTADADIDMDEGWFYTTGDSAVVLAIIDTGVDMGHPEFQDRIWLNPYEEFDDFDNDGNGFIDDGFGWNFISHNNAPNDNHGHGTHVAGIAAATGNNGIGIAGVDWNCRIMAVKVLGSDGSGTTSGVVGGILYAANEGAHVISLSLGHLGSPVEIEAAAVAYAQSLGVIVVAAMGNDDVGTTHYPAAYDGVISVGATDSDDLRADPLCYSPASGSNYGAWIDVCAPGNNVWSTYLVGFGSYANLCGTSMATPHVSGLVSLMLSLRPGWPLDSVMHILRNASDDEVGRPTEDVPGFDIYHGWGRINADRALRTLGVEFAPVLVTPDSASVTENEPLSFGLMATDSNLTALFFSMSPLANASLTDHGDGSATFDFLPDYSQSGEYQVEFVVTDGVYSDTSVVIVAVENGCQCPCYADPACNGSTDIVDVVNTVGVAFRGDATVTDPDCFPNPGGRTDVDCSGSTDVLDVVKIIDVAFRGSALALCNPCDL